MWDADPMYVDYRWIAMLDPVEFADTDDRADGPAQEPVEVQQLGEVDHHGRRAWEAVLRSTPAYCPRCACCSLLFGLHSERLEIAAGGPSLRDREPQMRYPDAHRVRLDVSTGVCVMTREIGGSYPGTGHDLLIEAVDEDVPDDLFAIERRRRLWRHRGRN